VLFPGIAAEQALPTIVKELMPPVMAGLVLAALLCAVMSPSLLLSASTIVSEDIIHRLKPSLNEKQVLTISRICVAVMGLLSLIVALYLKGIISSLLYAYTIFTAGVIPLVIAGFYREKLKVTSLGAMTALVGGGSLGLISQLLKIKYFDLGALGASICLLFVVSFIERKIRNLR
jgi:SSS family solute:Na+ symporter